MQLMSRDLARRFPALARRCVSGRPRGPAPNVVVTIRRGVRTIAIQLDEVRLSHSEPTAEPDDQIQLPMAVLEEVEGAGDDPVIVERTSPTQGVLRWTDRGQTRTSKVALTPPVEPIVGLAKLKTTAIMPPRFLVALHECGRTTAPNAMRFAMNRVQIAGSTGRIAGTDSHQALLYSGFTFPFAEDLLVPAVPVFGTKGLAEVGEIRLGRSAGEVIVFIGPWSIGLSIDRDGKFPDVMSVVPRRPSPTVLRLDDADAAAILNALPDLPGSDDESPAITLDLADYAAVRATGEKTDDIHEVRLNRSTVRGEAIRIALDPKFLRRLIALGLREIKIATPEKPLIATGGDLLYLAMPLSSDTVVPPSPRAVPVVPTTVTGPIVSNPQPRSTSPMKPESNGHAAPRTQPQVEDLDPLAEAESLRSALIEATQRVGRLMSALRGRNKEKKALATVWAGLKQLNLRP